MTHGSGSAPSPAWYQRRDRALADGSGTDLDDLCLNALLYLTAPYEALRLEKR